MCESEQVEKHLRLVHYVIRRRFFYLDPDLYEDVFQIGCLALVKAIRAFDPEKGVAFSTYAFQSIFGEIAKELQAPGMTHTLRIPRVVWDAFRDVAKSAPKDATSEEIRATLDNLGYSPQVILEVLEHPKNQIPLSLDTSRIQIRDEWNRLSDFLSDPKRVDARAEARMLLEKMVRESEDGRIVLYKMMGYNQREIADMLGKSPSKVSRTLAQAKREEACS